MDRRQLKGMGVAARGYGNACFLDEGDQVEADAVVFAPSGAGAWTVYATDEAATPIETSRRSFGTDTEAFDHMYQCLKDKVTARHAVTTASVEEYAASEARRNEPEQLVYEGYRLFDAYRRLGAVRAMSAIAVVIVIVVVMLVRFSS